MARSLPLRLYYQFIRINRSLTYFFSKKGSAKFGKYSIIMHICKENRLLIYDPLKQGLKLTHKYGSVTIPVLLSYDPTITNIEICCNTFFWPSIKKVF